MFNIKLKHDQWIIMLIAVATVAAIGGFFIAGALILNWKAFVYSVIGLAILNTIKICDRSLFNWSGKS